MVVGAEKGGTTGLFDTLVQHSQIRGAKGKEVRYFNDDCWYRPETLWQYHCFFPLPLQVSQGVKLFEATPYMHHPEIAQRLHAYHPQLKFIFLLRNPAERFFSAWTMFHYKFRTEPWQHLHDSRGFREVVADELGKWASGNYTFGQTSYLGNGMYSHQIQWFLNYFRMDQMHFVESAELLHNFDDTIEGIRKFIEVPREKLALVVSNKRQVEKRDLYAKEIEELREFYWPFNQKLFSLLGRSFASF